MQGHQLIRAPAVHLKRFERLQAAGGGLTVVQLCEATRRETPSAVQFSRIQIEEVFIDRLHLESSLKTAVDRADLFGTVP